METPILYIPSSARHPRDVVSAIPNGGAKRFSLEEMQAYVEGYVEFVRVNPRAVLVVNENGVMEKKEINPLASFIANRPILGNVLLCPPEMLMDDDDE